MSKVDDAAAKEKTAILVKKQTNNFCLFGESKNVVVGFGLFTWNSFVFACVCMQSKFHIG